MGSIVEVDLWDAWSFEKLDHTRARGRVYPYHLEKADITTEPPPPPPPLPQRAVIVGGGDMMLERVLEEENRRLRGFVGEWVRGLFGRGKSRGVERSERPPPYEL